MRYRKDVLTFILHLILPFFINGQTIKHSDNKPVVSAVQMNILYENINNPLRIAVPNFPCKALLVSCTNGKISGNDCEYSIIPEHIGIAEVRVMTVQKKDTIILGYSEFRVKRKPLPEASFCNHVNVIKRDDVISCTNLFLYFPNIDYLPPFRVTQFELIINRTIRLSSTQDKITAEMVEALKRIKPGDIIEFINIKAIALEAEPNTIEDLEDFKLRVE